MRPPSTRGLLLVCAYAADQLLGDPESFPHPVRWIGAGIAHGERSLRRPHQAPRLELALGAGLTAGIVAGSYALTSLVVHRAYSVSRSCGFALELALAWTCLAARNLQQEASLVLAALDQEDLPLARIRLARIVGRDTAHLEVHEISRAVIETLAESACDGIVAPLFYLALGGVPLGMAYKAVNTLDSMIGHADHRYFYFGKVAARLDDAANFLPARITALALCAASFFHPDANPHSAWQIWQRDAHLHKSPNAGRPESAIAGALHVQLGGDNTYAGVVLRMHTMGSEFGPATPAHARRASRLVGIATLVALAAAVLCTRGRKA